MRIGIDARCLMNNQYSGVSIYTLNLLRAIFELDRKNQYRLFYNSSKKVSLPEFNYPNVEYIGFHFPNKVLNLAINLVDYPKLDNLIGGCEVFFTPNLHFIALSDTVRKIMVVHDLSFLIYPEFFSWKMRLWHKLILVKNYLKQADVIIADSLHTKQNLVDLLSLSESKIHVIYPGVSQAFKPLDNLQFVKNKYQLPDRFILYLGNLEPRKNVVSMIQAYQQLNLEHSLVIGGGIGWKNGCLHKLVKDHKRIRFLGYVPEEDKAALYNLADIFVYPSYYEGFGLPPLEAMACGTPVIAGANSSLLEVVDNAGILIDPYNINDLKQAITSVLSNESLKQHLIDQGKEQANKFTWEAAAHSLLKLLS